MEVHFEILSSDDFTPAEKVVATVIYSVTKVQGVRVPKCTLSVDKIAVMARVSPEVVRRAKEKGEELGFWQRTKVGTNHEHLVAIKIPPQGYQWGAVESSIDNLVTSLRDEREKKRSSSKPTREKKRKTTGSVLGEPSHAGEVRPHASEVPSQPAVGPSHATLGPVATRRGSVPTSSGASNRKEQECEQKVEQQANIARENDPQPPSDRASRENGCLPADLEFPTPEELDAEGIVADGMDFGDPPVLADDEWVPPNEFDAPDDVVVDGFDLIDGEEPCEPSPEDLLDAVRGNVVSIDEARERRAAKAPGNAGGGRSCSAPVSRPSDVDASPTEALRIANEQRSKLKIGPIPDTAVERAAVEEATRQCERMDPDPRLDMAGSMSMLEFVGHVLAAMVCAHVKGAKSKPHLADGHEATASGLLSRMRHAKVREHLLRAGLDSARRGELEGPKEKRHPATGGIASHGPRR